MKIKFFTGSLCKIETDFNVFQETVTVLDVQLVQLTDDPVLIVKYKDKETPKPNALGFFESKQIAKLLKES